MSSNILPNLQRRLGVNWTSDEINAEKELGKIIYEDANIDLENLSEYLNDSVEGETLIENYMVKRHDFIAKNKLGNPATTLPSEILSNLIEKITTENKEKKEQFFEERPGEGMTTFIIETLGMYGGGKSKSNKSKYKKHKKKSKKRKSKRRKSKRRKSKRMKR